MTTGNRIVDELTADAPSVAADNSILQMSLARLGAKLSEVGQCNNRLENWLIRTTGEGVEEKLAQAETCEPPDAPIVRQMAATLDSMDYELANLRERLERLERV